MREYPLNEGPLAVNLANTRPSDRPGRDLLATAEDVKAWAEAQRGFADHALLQAVHEHAEEVLLPLRSARAAVRALLDALADGRVPEAADVDVLNALAASAPAHNELRRSGNGWLSVPVSTGTVPGRVVAAAAASAIAVATGPALVRRCGGPGCLLLFVGGHPRRTWCDSRTCGNRVRVARHSRQAGGRAAPATGG